MNYTAVNPHRDTSQLLLSLVVAALLWFIMFSPWTSPHINFWVCMTASALILTCLAFAFGGKESIGTDSDLPGAKTSTVLLGILIAAALWSVFWVGDKLSQLLFSFSRAQVNIIYSLKDNFSPTLLALLLLFIIGPAEEIFWRGYIQRTLSKRLSPFIAFLLTTACYTLVHLPSGNFMLIMAALVCGIVWGGLYWLMPQNLRAIIISHALWDAAAFVWLPF
ncbi:MAG: CPBP family intramembrane metalloprotease [Bacteroidaceae bacterium]|nr:CPBP family intramembrane metalloprotease [Bacteroidaceae bacterium]